MKMSELDAEVRQSKACVQILQLLESAIEEVVDKGKQPPNFSDIQFTMFDTARSKQLPYVDCREVVEWSSQLLFSFWETNVDAAVYCLIAIRELMFDDEGPASIVSYIINLLVDKGFNKYIAERIAATVSNFVQCFIDDKEDDIVYL